jgi:hypothetical protein
MKFKTLQKNKTLKKIEVKCIICSWRLNTREDYYVNIVIDLGLFCLLLENSESVREMYLSSLKKFWGKMAINVRKKKKMKKKTYSSGGARIKTGYWRIQSRYHFG